ncbi:DUF354 domain-containing protein [uncultured Desulfobacter sp.]|uniref:DUF354 domain-containing protein n=1 Tax=uncultured Desulfobacter sp. TaxID=240139 RepID=UPI002AA742B9|nr:DUF354 domain-containing protein [uncultured Desulfobacter sp.]
MRIFFDIGHPAHVHYFKNLIKTLEKKDHRILVSARKRYPVFELLKAYKIFFFSRGAGANSKLGKLFYLIFADFLLYFKAISFKPDLLISFGAVYLTHVAKIIKKPSIFLDDTDNARLNQKFYVPFATHILTPDIFQYDFGKKHIRFKSYMELSYLHPNYFSPNKTIFSVLKLNEDAPYVILRFVSWTANHDYGHYGISIENKMKAVKEFEKYCKVFISSEKPLPLELEKYRIKIPPHMMHDAIAYSKLIYGESATMASEAAVLGVPAIFIDNDGRCYTTEEENLYGLVYNYSESALDQDASIEKGVEILTADIDYKIKQSKLLKDKIDLTDYLVKFIEGFLTKQSHKLD